MENLGDLKAEVQLWLNRSDTETVNRIPQAIRLAETDIYRDLRCRDNEFEVEYTNASDPNALLNLPSNFKELRMVTYNGKPLKLMSDLEYQRSVTDGDIGDPYGFCIITRKLYLMPALSNDPGDWDDDVTIKLHYYGTESLNDSPVFQLQTNPVEVPAEEISDYEAPTQGDNNTTRLFLVAPDMYLSGVLHYMNAFLFNGAERDWWGQKFFTAVEALKAESDQAEMSGAEPLVGLPYGD